MYSILIQHNFTSGFGDFMRSITEYMTYCKKFKDIGYKIYLYLNLSRNHYTNQNLLNLILDQETLLFFDSITESYDPINSLEYNGLKYCFSSYDPQTPAMHMWDLFSDNPDETSSITNTNMICEKLPSINRNDVTYPILHSQIRTKSQIFKNLDTPYSFLHIRIEDFCNSSYHRDINVINKTINKAVNFLSHHDNNKFHIATNSEIVYNYFLNLSHTYYLYPYTYIELLNNEIGYARYSGIDPTILDERIVDTLAEMSSIRYADTIYIVTEFSWISSFLFYGTLLSNKEIQLVQ